MLGEEELLSKNPFYPEDKMFIIYGRYQGTKEEIDTAETKKEAEYLANEYRMAFGPGWSIWYVFQGDRS